MNLALLMLLALLWGVVLLPSAVRNRRHSLHHSMGGFERTMTVLSGGGNRPRDARHVLVPANAARIVSPPRGPQLARERRRRALVAMLSTSAIVTTGAILFGGMFWVPAAPTLVVTLVYVMALRQMAVSARSRAALVRLEERRAAHAMDQFEDRRAVVG